MSLQGTFIALLKGEKFISRLIFQEGEAGRRKHVILRKHFTVSHRKLRLICLRRSANALCTSWRAILQIRVLRQACRARPLTHAFVVGCE